MKKCYVGLPIVICWTIVLSASIVSYIWWTSDWGRFVPFAFVSLLVIPLAIEVLLIFICCQYVTINEWGIKKHNLFGKVVAECAWEDIQDVCENACWLYVSREKFVGTTKNWDPKKYISFMYSEKAVLSLQQYLSPEVLNSIEEISL